MGRCRNTNGRGASTSHRPHRGPVRPIDTPAYQRRGVLTACCTQPDGAARSSFADRDSSEHPSAQGSCTSHVADAHTTVVRWTRRSDREDVRRSACKARILFRGSLPLCALSALIFSSNSPSLGTPFPGRWVGPAGTSLRSVRLTLPSSRPEDSSAHCVALSGPVDV